MCYKARWYVRMEGDSIEVASKIIETDEPFAALYAAREIGKQIMPAFRAQGISPTQIEVHIDQFDPQLPLFAEMVQHNGDWTYRPAALTLSTINTQTKVLKS